MSRPRGTPRRPDDGIVDEVAIDRVATGDTMPLTDPERIEVSRRLEGSIDRTQEALKCGRSEAVQVAREARESMPALTEEIKNPPPWWVPYHLRGVIALFDALETSLPVVHGPRRTPTPEPERIPDDEPRCTCCDLLLSSCGVLAAQRLGMTRADLREFDREAARRMAAIGGTGGLDVLVRRQVQRGEDLPDNVTTLHVPSYDNDRREVETETYPRFIGYHIGAVVGEHEKAA